MKKKMVAILVAGAMIVGTLYGCSGSTDDSEKKSDNQQEENEQSSGNDGQTEKDGDVPTVEVFPLSIWGNVGMPDEDPIRDYIEEIAGGEWSLTTPTDGETELATRFASDSAPDLICFNDATQMQMFYDQGVLIDDWSPYADKLTNFLDSMGEQQIAYYTTEDGKLKALGELPGEQAFAFSVRQDWLDALNLDVPKTVEELLDVMRAFTYDDPDGNGVDDTYGFCVAGDGTTKQLAVLQTLFGNPSYYITDDGDVSHPILDGSYKEYLDYAKTIVNEGLINPDWYTLSWGDSQSGIYNGQYGVVYYPPEALLAEIQRYLVSVDSSDTTMLECWTVLDFCSESGGKGFSDAALSGVVLTVSAEAAKDEAKMEVICTFLEKTAGLSEEYYNIRHWDKFSDYVQITELGEGLYYFGDQRSTAIEEGDDFFTLYNDYPQLSNWGKIINCAAGHFIQGTAIEPDEFTEYLGDLVTQVQSYDKWSNLYKYCSFDSTTEMNAEDCLEQFAVSYLLGETDDYDGFAEEWLAAGGQEMLESATETFTAMGYLN